jgi:hypothetical protein
LPEFKKVRTYSVGTEERVSTEYLDRLSRLLKVGKNPACCRAINRILAEMKKRCEAGEYSNQTEAESAFRKFVEDEHACQKAKSASKQS